MAKPPSITVIVVTRDRPALLADALASVEAQSVAPLEVRIADDGDVPATDVVEGARLLEVTLIPVEVRRAGAARNRAAAAARGDVLAFLDDDDRWRREHLQALSEAFTDPDCGIAYRDAEVIRERVEPDGRRVDLETRTIARDWDPGVMRHDDFVPPSALAVRRSWFEKLGGFDESFGFSEDWDFLLRAERLGRPRRVPGVGVEIRMRDHGHASQDFGAERRACLDRLAAHHGLSHLEIKTFWEVARDVGLPSRGA
jgi:glycosyltransferase involved in cell wall biosynthesis